MNKQEVAVKYSGLLLSRSGLLGQFDFSMSLFKVCNVLFHNYFKFTIC